MAKINIEFLSVARLGILILWVFTLFSFFFLLTVPNSTEVVVRYMITFGIVTFFSILDWFLLSEAMGLKEDDPVGESFSSITDETSHRHFVRALLGDASGYGILIALIVGIIWSSVYAYFIIFQGQQFIAVPDLYTSVTLSSSPVPLIDTGTFTAFFEALSVAVTEEQLFTGLVFMTIWSVLLAGISKFGIRESRGVFVIVAIVLMIIAAVPAAWMDANGQHFFAFQKNKFAFDKAYNHFFLAAVIDGSTGSILPSVMAHFTNNFLIKNAKYHARYQAIPINGNSYTVGTPVRVG